jgi:hypothetical protein
MERYKALAHYKPLVRYKALARSKVLASSMCLCALRHWRASRRSCATRWSLAMRSLAMWSLAMLAMRSLTMRSLAINYLELIKLQFSISCPQGQVPDARRDLGQGLANDILDDGCDESIGSGDSHRDINVWHEVKVIFANSVQIDFRDKL